MNSTSPNQYELLTISSAAADAGVRLDVFLARHLVSRSLAQKLIRAGLVEVDGVTVSRPSHPLTGDESLLCRRPVSPAAAPLRPEKMNLDILYEDPDLLVVNKPKGMVVHPAPGHETGTLAHGLLACYKNSLSDLAGPQRPGLIHRLDKETSGCLIVARNNQVHRLLNAQLQTGLLRRRYMALVHAQPPDAGSIDYPIGRHPRQRLRRQVDVEAGRQALTHFTVAERFSAFSLLELELVTGRTHQIRVHLQAIGHPVVGDLMYGGGRDPLVAGGQLLHAWRVQFDHPCGGRSIDCQAPLPDVFADFLSNLRDGNKSP